ncbi:hypothetical protein GCM10010400_62130 [Streptomyces aculeolatus]
MRTGGAVFAAAISGRLRFSLPLDIRKDEDLNSMKTRKIFGTALLGAAFAAAAAGTASAATVPGLPDPVGQLTSPLTSVTGANPAANGTPAAPDAQSPGLGQLGAVTSALPVGALPL